MISKLFCLLFLFVSCQLLPDLRENSVTLLDVPAPVIWEQWKSNYDFNINANNTQCYRWYGSITHSELAPIITQPIPSHGIYTQTTETSGFGMANKNPGLDTGSYSFSFIIKKTSAHNRAAYLFNTTLPVLGLKFENSTTDHNFAVLWNTTTYTTTYTFPFDTLFHPVVFTLKYNGTNTIIKLYVDSYLKSTITVPGAFSMNQTSSTRRFLRCSAAVGSFLGSVKQMTIYIGELTQDQVSEIIDYEIPSKTTRVYDLAGQSNMSGSGSWTSVPDSVQIVPDNCLKWNPAKLMYEKQNYLNEPSANPGLSLAWALAQKYPDDDIITVNAGVASTSLSSTEWGAPSGTYYLKNKKWASNMLTYLINVENRNIIFKGGVWVQGENDSANSTLASAYQSNEANFFSYWQTDFGHTIIVDGLISSNIKASSYPYWATVNAGKTTNNHVLVNPSSFPLQTGNLHYTNEGYIRYGFLIADQF